MGTPEYLTYDRALGLLRQVIAEFGENHRYEEPPGAPSCLYVHDDGPGCIVAHALHRAGVSLDDLRQVEGNTPVDPAVAAQFEGWADVDALRLLAAVQEYQDEERPWGESLRLALEAGDRDD